MGETIEVTTGLPADWASVTGSGPAAARRRWIEFGQSWYPGEYQTFTLRGSGGECLVAMGGTVLPAPGPVARRDPYAILSGATAGMGLLGDGPHPWRSVPAADLHPCLMLMYPNYAAFPVGRRAQDPEALRGFLAGLTRWADARGVRSIVAMFLLPRADPLSRVLEEAGFAVLPLAERCDLPVTWSDFPGYLATLPSKRRIEVKRELREIHDRGLRSASRPMAADEPELLDLRCRLITKYDGAADREREAAIFHQIRRHVPAEDITVFTLSTPTRLTSFSLFIQDGPEWTAMLTGSDYDAPESSLGYFSTIFYQPAMAAPGRGVSTLAYGPGSVATKRRRGCQVSRCLIAVRTRN